MNAMGVLNGPAKEKKFKTLWATKIGDKSKTGFFDGEVHFLVECDI